MLKASGFYLDGQNNEFPILILFERHSPYASINHYKGMEIVKIDFPETLPVWIFCRMMNNNTLYFFLCFHYFHGNAFCFLFKA